VADGSRMRGFRAKLPSSIGAAALVGLYSQERKEMSNLSTLPTLQCSMALFIFYLLYSVHVYWLLGGGVGYNDEQVPQDPAAVGGG